MSRGLLTLCCASLVLAAGFGGTSSAKRAETVTVRIQVVTTRDPNFGGRQDMPFCKKGEAFTATRPCRGTEPMRAIRSFSLTCNPTGGTLPLADQVCKDIQRFPTTMLDPPPR